MRLTMKDNNGTRHPVTRMSYEKRVTSCLNNAFDHNVSLANSQQSCEQTIVLPPPNNTNTWLIESVKVASHHAQPPDVIMWCKSSYALRGDVLGCLV
jgi:hypothetical protein